MAVRARGLTPRAAVLLLATAIVACGSAQAKATSPATAKHHQATRHAQRHAARKHARHFSVEMRDDGVGTSATYASRAPAQLHLRPSVDTRFGRGAVASFGYHPGVVPPTLGPHELNGAADSRLSHPESSAGVSVKIPL